MHPNFTFTIAGALTAPDDEVAQQVLDNLVRLVGDSWYVDNVSAMELCRDEDSSHAE